MRVLVVSDTDAGRREIRRLLDSAGFETVDPAAVGAGALLAAADWQADAAIGVLLDRRPTIQKSSAVMLELGIALGRSLPTLIVGRAPKRFPALTGISFVSASIDDLEAQLDLELKIELFLEGVRMNAPRRVDDSVPATPIRSPAVLPNDRRGSQLEEQVAELLVASGAYLIASSEATSIDIRSDLTFLVEGLESRLGLILVEVAGSAGIEQSRLRSKSDQLAEYVARSGAGLGLLIVDGPEPPAGIAYRPLVATLTISQLRQQIAEVGLSAMLLHLRNSAIHGLGGR